MKSYRVCARTRHNSSSYRPCRSHFYAKLHCVFMQQNTIKAWFIRSAKVSIVYNQSLKNHLIHRYMLQNILDKMMKNLLIITIWLPIWMVSFWNKKNYSSYCGLQFYFYILFWIILFYDPRIFAKNVQRKYLPGVPHINQ